MNEVVKRNGKNAEGCIGYDSIMVGTIEDRTLMSTAFNSNIHCYGSVQVEAQGGIGFYQYRLSPATGTQSSHGIFDGLCWGEYNLTATDSAGCTISKKIIIDE